MNLRERVEALLPNWRSWYPSLFHAAEDLGVIRPRVCAPSSLLLSTRHHAIREQAANAHREYWGGIEEVPQRRQTGPRKRRKHRKR